MSGAFGLGFLVLLMTAVNAEAQSKLRIRSKCLGNLMRVDVGPLGGKLLEVAVVINNSTILLSPSLASQCGFTVTMDQPENAVVYASLQNCFAHNVDDRAFTTTLNFRLHGNQMDEDELHQVAETCRYAAWASREIVCNHNYAEVSVRRADPGDYLLPNYPLGRSSAKFGDPHPTEKRPVDGGLRIASLLFFTPEERTMTVTQALRSGYEIASTPSRLVLRSPKMTAETYIQNVAGVPMTVLRTSTVTEQKWLTRKTNAAAACPITEGSVSFTPNAITWFLPWHVDPLVSSERFKLLEVHMGIGGQRLDASELAARGYSVSVNGAHIVVELPVGAVGGYFKSHVRDDQYFISYTIEPMVELLWIEDAARQDTRYKVLFPITTPLLLQPLQVLDKTVPEEQMFRITLGPLGADVVLVNVTFPSEVLSVSDCNARGFNVMEHVSPNSSTKVFTLEVPFMDPAVLEITENGFLVYSLQMTFGLVVLPEFAPFSHTANLEAKLVNIVPPSVSGTCDAQNFHILVKYGTRGFQTIAGKQTLSPVLAQQYGFRSNGTHFSLVVPFSAPDVVFEAIEGSHIRSRLDVVLRNPETNLKIKEFSVSCNFPSPLTECFPNGTMTSWAVKLESVPSLNTSLLTLRDPSCGPSYSDDRLAYFVFTGKSCGTTRKFLPNAMLYENEISLPEEHEMNVEPEEHVYELRVSCYYDFNTTQAVALSTLGKEPSSEDAQGELQVAMRISLDDSYSIFYRDQDYPLVKYLQQPLYFEVELMRSTNPELSLELENCWATLKTDWTSQPRWDLIIQGCANKADPYPVSFHPVRIDARVRYPSHFKRFEVKMFAFTEAQQTTSPQFFVYCDVVICDARSPLGGVCNRQCPSRENKIKGQRRAVSHVLGFKQVSSGPIQG